MADHAVIAAAVAGVAAFAAGVLLYPHLITRLARMGAGQHVASYGPATHRIKEGTPTLGGILIAALAIVAWLAVDRGQEGFIVVFALLGGALVGGLDDFINIRSARTLGLPGWHKLAAEGVVGVLAGLGLLHAGFTQQFFPGLGAPDLGWGIVIIAALAVVGTSNAVNLTDGVDGLAASCTTLAFVAVTVLAAGRGDVHVALMGAVLTGVTAAFLFFNWHPARLFMGDTGSLALGCALVVTCAELHLLWALPLLGVVFLVETLSVIVNVTAIRRFHRRILRASPLHHHFEDMGLHEQRLVAVFAAVAAAAAALTIVVARQAGPLA